MGVAHLLYSTNFLRCPFKKRRNGKKRFAKIGLSSQKLGLKGHSNIQKTLNPAKADKVNSYQHFVSHPHTYASQKCLCNT